MDPQICVDRDCDDHRGSVCRLMGKKLSEMSDCPFNVDPDMAYQRAWERLIKRGNDVY